MMKYIVICLFFIFTTTAYSEDVPIVELQTSLGNITLELNPEKAPKTVENFLSYAREGFYQGTLLHRVIKDFMIQGGGYTQDFVKKSTRPPIPNEAYNSLQNKRGTIAMARTADPHSATAQFFINVVDNPFLDHKSKTTAGWGYTVFGKVIEGITVVDEIQQVKTGAVGPFTQDAPLEPIIIKKVNINYAAPTPQTSTTPEAPEQAPIPMENPIEEEIIPAPDAPSEPDIPEPPPA